MIVAEVFDGETLVYRTSNVRQFQFGVSLTPENSNLRPGFFLNIPNVGGQVLRGSKPTFTAKGNGTLGSVNFSSGAAARDGTETYDVIAIDAAWEPYENGFGFDFRVTLGEPMRNTFCYDPPRKPVGRCYRIACQIPISQLAKYWMASHKAFENLKAGIERDFGANAAAAIEPYIITPQVPES